MYKNTHSTTWQLFEAVVRYTITHPCKQSRLRRSRLRRIEATWKRLPWQLWLGHWVERLGPLAGPLRLSTEFWCRARPHWAPLACGRLRNGFGKLRLWLSKVAHVVLAESRCEAHFQVQSGNYLYYIDFIPRICLVDDIMIMDVPRLSWKKAEGGFPSLAFTYH